MNNRKAWFYWAAVLIWMAVIFSFSAQPAEKSSSVSSPITQRVVEAVYPSFDIKPQEDQAELIECWTTIIRKSAHFIEYALLGVLLYGAIGSISQEKKKSGLRSQTVIGLLIGAGYAATDELHQLFVPGRSGQFSDVVLDSFGVAFGILLTCLVQLLINACRIRSGRRTEQ